jgi:beta-galactosidase/beta-glucuronidase
MRTGFQGFSFRLISSALVFAVIVGTDLAGKSADGETQAGEINLDGGGWRLQNAQFVSDGADRISQPEFAGRGWLPAVVPGTILASYVAAGAVPDPWFGDQNEQISEEFFNAHDFWYRRSFDLPANLAGRRLWLLFGGVNWKAEVFLNGRRVGRIDAALARTEFDITALARLGAGNGLAVLIHPVVHPGPAHHKILNQTIGNGGIIGLDSPTFVSSIGWNWLPTIRGRNAGIWNHVVIASTGSLSLADPWVTTRLPLPDTSRADLTVNADVRNNSDAAMSGVLIGTIGNLTFRHAITVPPGTTQTVSLDPSTVPELRLAQPRLWWPNGYGDPALYRLRLRIETEGGISDEKTVAFGVRELGTRVDHGVLYLFVNGRRILLRGGNWGMDEGMLRCDAAGYELRVAMHRDMHLNMIRNWVGMVGRDEFYDACDRNGILVWDDFWLANPVDGPDPADHALFLEQARDKIRRVRSHASLALYCGRNEGVPPADLDAALNRSVRELDGTRTYLSSSADGVVTGHGPYDLQDPEWYFANRGATLHSELGIVAVPVVESMREMMPADKLWPINQMWAVHDYQTPRMPLYTQRIERRYGPAYSLEDYCRKAQMVNLESAKAMYESLQSRQGSGILLWMTQAAWPSLICQLYDYYFEPTAAYYGAKTACEPLHILWDQNSDRIKVANDTLRDRPDLVAEAATYDLGGVERWHRSARISAPSQTAADCFALQRPADPAELFFVRLRLRESGAVVSENFYWSAGNGRPCTDLNKLPPAAVSARAVRMAVGKDVVLEVTIRNDTPTVAVMIRLKVVRARSGKRVLPAFYDDNFFSLLPGEVKSLKIRFAAEALGGEEPKLMEEGWNTPEREIQL